jgi:prolyl oligopeptidase
MNQPPARVAPVRETLYGTTIDDPYRWMEDWHGEELHAWVTDQGAYARQFLDLLPDRAALYERIASLTAAGTMVTTLDLAAGKAFYLRRDPGENLAKLVVHRSLDAPATVLVDPNRLAGATHTAIDWYAPSPDGSYVAYGISEGGSEASVLHVLDIANGDTLPDTITRTIYGGVNWLPDGGAFLYNRSTDPLTDEGSGGQYLNSRVYLHRLGDDPEQPSKASSSATIQSTCGPTARRHATASSASRSRNLTLRGHRFWCRRARR